MKNDFGVTARDIIVNPGPIYPQDAKKYFNMEQRPAKQIDRIVNPELHPEIKGSGWVGGDGGWSSTRFKGTESDLECKVVDQYWAHEITGDEVFQNYLAHNAPVLIRGLLDEWKVTSRLLWATSCRALSR